MADTEQLSLSWDAHQRSICGGLSHLQQHGELVDMTLAADGHHVKVHQLVMSLVSPYIKELISSAHCPHPIIFLNNISYTTLCAILEYIYTGEVLVPKYKLADLITAGKALHIRGLREMSLNADEETMDPITTSNITPTNKCISEKLKVHREKVKTAQQMPEDITPAPICKVYVDETNNSNEDTAIDINDESVEPSTMNSETHVDTSTVSNSDSKIIEVTSEDSRKILLNPKVQYTVSNQGGLQIIYNRYIYHLRYYSKKNGTRLWRCIEYSNQLKCSANICTDKNNQVSKRSFTHNHAFHDTKILKKLRNGVIYSLFKEAENIADCKKKQRHVLRKSISD